MRIYIYICIFIYIYIYIFNIYIYIYIYIYICSTIYIYICLLYLVLSTFCTCSLAAIMVVFSFDQSIVYLLIFFSWCDKVDLFFFFSNIYILFSPRQWFVVYFYLRITCVFFFPYHKCYYSISYIYIYIYMKSSIWKYVRFISIFPRYLVFLEKKNMDDVKSIQKYKNIYIYIYIICEYIYIYTHNMWIYISSLSSSSSPTDSMDLPDSLHLFLSSIAPGRSSKLHPVSTWSRWK